MPDTPTRTTLTAQGVEIERVTEDGGGDFYHDGECIVSAWPGQHSAIINRGGAVMDMREARIVAIAIGLACEWITEEQGKVADA